MISILPLQMKYCEEVFVIAKEGLPEYWSLNEIQNVLKYDYDIYFVAVENRDLSERVVGFAGAMLLADEAELLNIAVLNEKRKSGIGTMLLDKLFDEVASRGGKRMFLEVREGNTAARKLYFNKGFGEISVRKDYYSNPTENAVIMECRL